MADASGAFDAAVEAAAKAINKAAEAKDDLRFFHLNEEHEYYGITGVVTDSARDAAIVAVEAAAPVLLAAERERIAQQILRAASVLPADALSARGHAEWAAEIARAGQPPAETQGGQQ